MRWITRYIQDGSERVLQYRQKYEKTSHFANGIVPEEVKELAWGPWVDVPEL